MSKPGKIFLIAGLLFLFALFVFRLAYNGWHDSMWVPLVLGTLLLAAGFFKERTVIAAVFTMRTTKHGLNMGAIVLMSFAGLICLNILAVRYEKKFDWTSDKLNTLSDQSVKATQALTRDTELVLLYRAEEQGGENIQKSIGDLAKMYRNVSAKVRFTAFNALKDPAAAQKFDYATGPFAFFAVQGERKVKIDQPTEEGVTRALLKLGREKRKVIYLTLGHGERDPDARDADGISFLKEQLEITYEVRSLTLYQTGNKVPDDAAAVAVIRPIQQFLDVEIQALRDYARRGGRILLAIDPGMKHGLAQLTKTFGIEFGNDFVLDLRSQMIQEGPATVLGSTFPAPSPVTRAFAEGTFAVLHVASTLKRAPDAAEALIVEPLLGTDAKTMATSELGQVAFNANGPHLLAMTAAGSLPLTADRDAALSGKPFTALVFGDSDFASNSFIQRNLNNDLVMNAVAFLTDDKDLISIRPKQARGTPLEITSQSFAIYAVFFLLVLPLSLFALGTFMWWRRRGG